MNCPKCGKEMERFSLDESHNANHGKRYDRERLVCRADDLWVTVETPKA